jgi:hypothetical protein
MTPTLIILGFSVARMAAFSMRPIWLIPSREIPI